MYGCCALVDQASQEIWYKSKGKRHIPLVGESSWHKKEDIPIIVIEHFDSCTASKYSQFVNYRRELGLKDRSFAKRQTAKQFTP